MPSKHLIAVVLLVCVCLGIVALYVWPGMHITQPGENVQPEVENVDLVYLAGHMQEFENKRVRVEGVVQHYPDRVTETIGDFVLVDTNTSVAVLLENRSLSIPPENSIVVVEGTVACAYGFLHRGVLLHSSRHGAA